MRRRSRRLTAAMLALLMSFSTYLPAAAEESGEIGGAAPEAAAEELPGIEDYDVVWDSPSGNIEGSMPVGNGTNTALVWVDGNGDLILRLARGDSWDEYSRSIKLGYVRIHFEDSLNLPEGEFEQILNYYDGEIEIKTPEITVRVWADANQDIIHVEAEEKQPGKVEVSVESWREEEKVITWLDSWQDYIHVAELDNSIGIDAGEIVVSADQFETAGDGICWYHRNETSVWDETLETQGITEEMVDRFGIQDPLTYRTTGGMISGTGLKAEGDKKLVSSEASGTHRIDIATHTEITENAETWTENIEAQMEQNESKDIEELRADHLEYWNDFWDKSYVIATGDEDADTATKGWISTRWMEGCAGRAEGPIEFNGGVFAFEEDFLQWHDYTQFNQRFAYWSMLQSGDFDLMQSYFDMNVNSMPVAQASVKARWGENDEGFVLPEHMILYGPQSGSHYGWNREGKEADYVEDAYTRKLYAGTPEIGAMMVTYYEYTLDDEFAREKMIPFCDGVVKWYSTHFEKDENGKLCLKDIYSGEADRSCDNPMSDVAGLNRIVDGLLALPESLTDAEDRAYWEEVKEILPELPVYDGRLQTADNLRAVDSNETNNQNLFAIFPYGYYGNGKEDLETAVASYYERKGKYPESGTQAWRHDALQASALGLTDEAKYQTVEAFGRESYRYEGFVDGDPDSASMSIEPMAIGKTALQQMLVYPGKESSVMVLNAWPEEWDVSFRLYAPGNTTIEGEYRDGVLQADVQSEQDRTLDIRSGMICNTAEITSGEGQIIREDGTVRLSLKKGETAGIMLDHSGMGNGTYKITAAEGALDIRNGSEGSPVILKPDFAGDLSQKWNLSNCGIGQYEIRNAETGKALTAAEGGLAQTLEGDVWSLKETEDGIFIYTRDERMALGISDGQLALTDPENAAALSFEPQDAAETPSAVGEIEITGAEGICSGESVRLTASAETEDGNIQELEMVWNVKNRDGRATVTADGVLTAEKAGTVIVQAYPRWGTANTEEQEIEILPGMMEEDPLIGEVFGRQDDGWEQACPPEYAFDNDLTTAYDGQNGGYAGMKMAGPFYLTGFRYAGRWEYDGRIDGAQIQGSNDGETWDTLYDINLEYTNPVYNGVWFSEEERPEKAYSYYRIYSGNSQYCNVAEVEFYGQAEDPRNGLENLINAAGNLVKEEYEPEGTARVEATVQEAESLPENAPAEVIQAAKDKLSEALKSLKKPYLLCNYDTQAEKDGDWKIFEDSSQYSGRELYAETAGSVFRFTFEGTGFEMLGNKNPGLSSVQITVDGETAPGGEEVSLFDPNQAGYTRQSIFTCTGLEYGSHTVEITLLDMQNPWGQGPKAGIDAFRIFTDSELPEEPEEPADAADKTALNMVITMAEKLEAEQASTGCYTEESWAAVQTALDAARAIAADESASQEDVDSAFLELITAVNLLENAVQRVGLEAAIEGAKAILADAEGIEQYTPESVEALRTALAEAERVYAEEGADQETINAAARMLMDAVTSLVVVDVDTRLDILIQKAEELLADSDQYTSASVENLQAALDAAKLVAEDRDATDVEINEAYSALAEEMTSLVRKADKSELKTALDKAAEILADSGRYVEETIAGLQAAADAAQAVYDKEDASPAEVGEAVKSLVDEILKARLLGDVDGNGAVDSADSAEVLKYAAEAQELDEVQSKAADVNGDGAADSTDASEILKYASEVSTEF